MVRVIKQSVNTTLGKGLIPGSAGDNVDVQCSAPPIYILNITT